MDLYQLFHVNLQSAVNQDGQNVYKVSDKNIFLPKNEFIYLFTKKTTTNTTQTKQFNFLVIINFYLNYVLFQVVHDVSESKQCQPEENNYRSTRVLLENLTESSVQVLW